MSVLTVGTHRLPPAETALIRSLVRLFAHEPSFRWRYVDAGPCDAILVDDSQSPAHWDEACQLARAALRVTRVTGRTETLQRPIRADQLKARLERLALELPPPAVAREPLPVANDDHAGQQPSVHARFRLRQWPPADLLGGDPHGVRLATLLARRALAARELSRITELPVAQCLAFLNTLHHAGVLDVVSAGAEPAAPAPQPARAQELISGIRRRLGL